MAHVDQQVNDASNVGPHSLVYQEDVLYQAWRSHGAYQARAVPVLHPLVQYKSRTPSVQIFGHHALSGRSPYRVHHVGLDPVVRDPSTGFVADKIGLVCDHVHHDVDPCHLGTWACLVLDPRRESLARLFHAKIHCLYRMSL